MSSSDDFRKKAIHKQIDSNRNIRAVIIPHNVRVGRKTKSINKETLQSLSGTYEVNEFVIRKDNPTKFTRLELNNGFKTGRGTTIRFACGGTVKGQIAQRNVGDMEIQTFQDDLHLIAQDGIALNAKGTKGEGIFFKTQNTTRMHVTKAGDVGIGTTSPDADLHVAGDDRVRIGEAGTWGSISGNGSVDIARLELAASDESGGVQAFFQAVDNESSSNAQFGTYSSHALKFYTANSHAMTIDTSQEVGIGTSSPSYKLHVLDSSSTDAIAKFHNSNKGTSADGLSVSCGPNAAASLTTANSFIRCLDGDGSFLGALRCDGSGGVQLTPSFTGGHPTVIESDSYEMGLIVESTGELWANNPNNINTAIPKVHLSDSDNSSSVYGVLSAVDTHEGYQKVWGVGETESQVYVNGLGEGKVWVTNKSGDISNGDYITTSVVPGYGMKQSDDILRNYTVAKCVESVDWSQVADTITHSGVEYKKYLIACTYHSS